MELLTILYAVLAATLGLGDGAAASRPVPVAAECQTIDLAVVLADPSEAAQPVTHAPAARRWTVDDAASPAGVRTIAIATDLIAMLGRRVE